MARTVGVVAYTAIFGGRDTLKDPAFVTQGCRYVCFTDAPLQSDVWEIVEAGLQGRDPRRAARRYKLLSHRAVDSEYSLWVDGSFRINADVRDVVDRYLASADIALFSHPDRDCVYDEAEVCVQLGLDDLDVIRHQIDRYRAAGLPRHGGLSASGVVLRRHTAAVVELNDTWWRECDGGSCRDQLSLDFCLWRLGLARGLIPGNIRKSDEFQLLGHVPRQARLP